MMNRTRHFMLVGLAACLFGLTACDDPAANQRAEALTAIKEATASLASVAGPVLPGSDEFGARKTQLQGIARKLASVRTEDRRQSASQSMLLSSVYRELADLNLAEASQLESQLHNERTILSSRVNAVQRLDAVADGGAAINVADIQNQLSSFRENANDRLRAFGRIIDDLDGPIADLDSANRDDQAKVDQLRDRANTLRREATDLGDADGFENFERALELEREADRYEARIANREIDLDHDLQPQHDLANSKVVLARDVLGAIDDADRGLNTYASSIAASVNATRSSSTSLRADIRQQIEALGASVAAEGSDLATAYTETLDLLNQSAQKAGSAAGAMDRRHASGARMAEARIHARRGQVYLKISEGLSEQVAVLAAASDAGAASAGSQLSALNDRVQEAKRNATAAFEQAKGAISQAGSSDASATAFASAIDRALANLGGAAASPAAPTAASSATTAPVPAPDSQPESQPAEQDSTDLPGTPE